MKAENHMVPLCVDLDGTLIHSDLLLESLLLLFKRNPLYLLLVPFWLLQGRAWLKHQVANRVALNPAALPYNHAFIAWLAQQKNAGRNLWLCTGSNYQLAELVARHLPLFAGVIASSDTENITGRSKAEKLVAQFGERGFDYCGNHAVDLAVWRVSRAAIVVNGNRHLVQQASSLSDPEQVQHFPPEGHVVKSAVKALRLHQWAKNVLIFVPVAAAHKIGDGLAVQHAILAFFAFGLTASSVYLLNDMLDLEADRQHPGKMKRPFASGDLSLSVGFFLIPILLAGATLLASVLPFKFLIVLAGYYALTVAYSFGLKSIVLVDTITLAGLYTVRIVAGAEAVRVPLSFWLLLFAVFLFLSLALVKRYAELELMQRAGKLKAAGRGYHVDDLPILQSMGTASGYLCVLVLALYINSPVVVPLYRHPQIIWFLCVLLLFWVSRVWLIAQRGQMNDDPVIFAMKDKVSLLIGVLSAITVMLAV